MGDYHSHYLKKDVLLLADVCEKFIGTCIKFDGLDPCHYFSSPGYTKNDWCRISKNIRLWQVLIHWKRLRGGISYIAKRKANNKYMNYYEPKKPSTFITYLDMSNLYGWAMSDYLPYGKFNWLKNVDGFDVISISEKSPIGYFLEIDLEYPDELHELYNDYPLAPEKFAVSSNVLSKYCKKIAD